MCERATSSWPCALTASLASNLDSGANISTISESEARRLGLKIESASDSAPLTGIIGGFSYKLATLNRLEIGGATLRNVAFLVVGDDHLPFTELPKGQQAILGISVLLGLRTMRVRPTGEQMEIGFASQPLTERSQSMESPSSSLPDAVTAIGSPL
jgi:hypothetical protein